MNRDKTRGFTLIELMIVVAVIALLAGIAFPSFREEVREARRSDGIAGLISIRMALEKYRANNTTYITNIGTLGESATSPDGFYNLSITAANASTYTISADPTGDQVRDTACDPITMNQNGTISPAACVKK